MIVLATLVAQAPPVHSLELWSEHPIWMDVESVTSDGNKMTVVDKRRLMVTSSTKLEFVAARNHFIRFRYVGASPHTVSTLTLTTVTRKEVPAVLPGGELFLLVHSSPIRPRFIEVSGARTVRVPVDKNDYVAVHGLPPGEYTVTGVYETGLHGIPRRFQIVTGETTSELLTPDSVGGLELTAPKEICETASAFGIAKSDPAGIRNPIFVTKLPSCSVELTGIPTGELQAFYRLISGALRTQQFQLDSQQIAKVALQPFRVTVFGRATLNGQPVSGARLIFTRRRQTEPVGPSAWTQTDAAGYFTIGLDRGGEHSIHLQKGFGLQTSKSASFVEGSNELIWALQGGTIHVIIEGWDGGADVEIVLVGQNTTRSARWTDRLAFQGLPFGSYELRVDAGPSPRRTLMRKVTVNPTMPEAKVTVDIARR